MKLASWFRREWRDFDPWLLVWILVPLAFVVVVMMLFRVDLEPWLSRPISEMVVGDALLLLIVYVLISKR